MLVVGLQRATLLKRESIIRTIRREFKEAVYIAKISGYGKMVAENVLDKFVQQSMQGSH